MAFNKDQHLTFTGWLTEITRPQRRYFQMIGGSGKFVGINEKGYQRAVYIYTEQGRCEQSPVHIVECPDSNCKVLIQTNGNGKYKGKLGATWRV